MLMPNITKQRINIGLSGKPIRRQDNDKENAPVKLLRTIKNVKNSCCCIFLNYMEFKNRLKV